MMDGMKQRQKRHLSLQTSLTIALIVVGVVVGGTVSALLYNSFQNQLLEDLKSRLESIATIVSLQIDGDAHAALVVSDNTQNEIFQKLQEDLFRIIETEPELIYIYSMRRAEDGTIYFYLDAGRDPTIEEYKETIVSIGDIPYEEPTETLIEAFDEPKGTVAEPDIYTDEWGSFLSAYAPIYKSDGSLEGYIGVDITADKVIARERQFLTRTLLWLTLSLPLTVLIGWLLGRHLARPAIELTKSALQIAEGNLEPIEEIPASSQETYQLTQAFNKMTDQLRQLVSNLEERVIERTQEMERRTQELEATSRVARDAIASQDLDALLDNTVKLLQESFGYYHVGIFLIDDRREYAVLHAATGEAGNKLLEENTSLRIGEAGIVAKVADSGYPRIALEIETDSVYMSHPLLPDTRSEMALPLMVGKRVIGVLDIQSNKPTAFDEGNLRRMQTFADQMAIAIENARLAKQAQDTLDELRQVSQEQIRTAWARQAAESASAFEYDGLNINPIKQDIQPDVLKELQAGRTVNIKTGKKNLPSILVPLLLRGQLIGTIGIEKDDPDYIWPEDEIAIIESAALQATLSLETARLLEDAQRRASREQAIGEITNTIGMSTDMESILRSVVSELGRQLSETKVAVELSAEAEWDVE